MRRRIRREVLLHVQCGGRPRRARRKDWCARCEVLREVPRLRREVRRLQREVRRARRKVRCDVRRLGREVRREVWHISWSCEHRKMYCGGIGRRGRSIFSVVRDVSGGYVHPRSRAAENIKVTERQRCRSAQVRLWHWSHERDWCVDRRCTQPRVDLAGAGGLEGSGSSCLGTSASNERGKFCAVSTQASFTFEP